MRLFLLGMLFLSAFSVQARPITDLRTYGKPAKTEMYVFTSITCPHCKDFHQTIFPELLKKYANKGQALIKMVDVVTDEKSMKAAMLMRCLPDDKAHRMMNWLYKNQDKIINSKTIDFLILQYTQSLGMLNKDFDACLANKHLKEEIAEQRDLLVRLYQVRGWPAIAIKNGNSVKTYMGSNKRAVLNGIDHDLKEFRLAK